MRGDEWWHSSASGLLLAGLVIAALALAVLSGRAPEPPSVDTRYLHQLPGKTEPGLNPADAHMQAKSIAASRHRSPEEVGQLMDDYTEGRGTETLGHQRITIEQFNHGLDERWPAK